MSQSDIELVCDSVTQQIQEQCAKYGVDAELSGYAKQHTMFEIPSEWVRTSINVVCELNPKIKLDDDLNVGFMPMSAVPKEFHGKPEYEIKKWHNVKTGYTQFKDGDALFAKITPCFENGKACVIEQFPNGWGAGSTEFYVLRPINQCVHPKLLLALVKTREFLMTGAVNMTGSVGHKRVSKEFVENYPLPFPPLAEQQQIAAKLDELLAQVDTLKTRLDTIPKILKRFRQSVLAAAVSGKLTEDWRIDDYISVNLNLSKHNFELLIPKCWRIAALEESCKILSGNAFKSDKFIGSGIPVIKISNIQYGEFEIKNQQFLPASFLEIHSKFKVEPSDLLMALTRPITNNTLKVCRYPDHAEIGLLNQRVCKFTFKNESEKKYFEILFQSDYFKSQVEDNLSETLQPNLSPADLKKFVVAIPDGEEQTEIGNRVEQLFTYADQIEQRVKDAQARVNHLTQAILAKAFRGELTADWREQNPELISGENSAEALLAKIKAARESIAATKKIGRKVKV